MSTPQPRPKSPAALAPSTNPSKVNTASNSRQPQRHHFTSCESYNHKLDNRHQSHKLVDCWARTPMFSPTLNGAAPAPSIRKSRRRPRSSESLTQQPKSKRQRSGLSEQTFISPDGEPEMVEVKKASPVATRRESPRELTSHRRELAVRGKKPKVGERGNKGDGSVVLVCG
jgi:hypothetical protein